MSATTNVVSVTVDIAAPALANVRLDPASDTGTAGDNITTAASVTLLGNSQPGQAVQLAFGTTTLDATADGSGQFSFTGVALTLGANAFTFTATDTAGNSSSASLTVQRTPSDADATAPVVTAALKNDTGALATDGITTDPTISGQATDAVGATVLRAAARPDRRQPDLHRPQQPAARRRHLHPQRRANGHTRRRHLG